VSFDRRQYSGGAVKTTLAGGLASNGTSISITSATGWPAGSGNFTIVINRGTATEEKVLCSSLSGTTLTVAASGRGYDGTAASAHLTSEPVELVASSVDFDEANNTASQTLGRITTKGDLLVGTSMSTTGVLALGTTGQVLTVDTTQATGTKWAANAAVPLTTVTAKGDLILGTASSTVTNLPIGTTGQFLTVSGGTAVWGGPNITAASVATDETTSSVSFTDLATPGPAVTVTIGSSGIAILTLSAYMYLATGSASPLAQCYLGYAASGANTTSPVLGNTLWISNPVSGAANVGHAASRVLYLTGLSAGSTTFTCKYATVTATAHFSNRTILVQTL